MDPFVYPVGTQVRLDRSFDGCASGAVGTVVGFYRTEPPTYAVTIGGRPIRVPPEYLVAVDDGDEIRRG